MISLLNKLVFRGYILTITKKFKLKLYIFFDSKGELFFSDKDKIKLQLCLKVFHTWEHIYLGNLFYVNNEVTGAFKPESQK